MVNSIHLPSCLNFRIVIYLIASEKDKQSAGIESNMSKTNFWIKDFTTWKEALTNRKAMHYNFTLYSLS